MARSGGRFSVVAVMAALVLLATPLPVLAAFAINIVGPAPDYDGAGITVPDDTSGDLVPSGADQNTNAGVIAITAGLGGLPPIPGFSLHFDVATSNSPGGPSFSLLDLIWGVSALGGAGGTIQVTASATDYTFPPAGVGSILTSTFSGSLIPAGGASSLAAQQWVNLANVLFGLGLVTPGLQGPFSTAAISNSASIAFISSTPYSITDRLSVTLGANAFASGDLQSTVVPEPVTMFLGGTGLLVLAYAGRRRLFGR